MDSFYINKIEDNQRDINAKEFERDKVSQLLYFGNRAIETFDENSNNLLLYSNNIDETKSLLSKDKIFEHYVDEEKNCVYISTNNIVGFLGRNNQFIKICSRFDRENEKDFFLQYMLEKVLSINLLNYEFKNSYSAILDMLMLLFPNYLQNAMSQGIYREYITRQYNNDNVKGTINIARHIKKNYPFTGNIAYSVREYSYNNDIFHLIRHTIEYIKTKELGKILLNSNPEIVNCVKKVEFFTPDYKKQDKHIIISKNVRKPIRQPYYMKFKDLQDLCIKILRFDEIMYGDNEDKTYGVLIDISWLFEEYIWAILKNLKYKHSNNRKKINGTKIFEDDGHKRYLDFYDEENGVVLDAKYKFIERKNRVSECNSKDIDQLITYMFITKSKKSAFVYPKLEKEKIIAESILLNETYGGRIGAIGINISKETNDYYSFRLEMKKNEEEFKKEIESFTYN